MTVETNERRTFESVIARGFRAFPTQGIFGNVGEEVRKDAEGRIWKAPEEREREKEYPAVQRETSKNRLLVEIRELFEVPRAKS